MIDANAAKAVAYQKALNREQVDSLVAEWKSNGAMQVTELSEIDSDSFKSTAVGSGLVLRIQSSVSTGMSRSERCRYRFISALHRSVGIPVFTIPY